MSNEPLIEVKQMSQTFFDPYKHIPPKYDIFGCIKPRKNYLNQFNILTQKEEIKIPWMEKDSIETEVKTRSKLIDQRKKERIPDISYDLDKDGYVGGKDFVIAKRFDVDCDGKLNDKEREAAYKGIENNVEDNYIWNVDNQGGTRPFRLLQKRGVIVDAENFLPIRDTYPEHPLTKVIPHCATYTDLKVLRKNAIKEDIDKKIKQWEENNPPIQVNEQNKFANIETKHHSIREVKEQRHQSARVQCGLKEYEDDIRDYRHCPSLLYVNDPKHKVIKDIQRDLQKENLEVAYKLANNNHKDDVTRLNERENEIFAKMFSQNDRKTFNKVKEQRKKETLNYNIKHFSKQTIGIHGHDLPKFSRCQSTKDFWKKKEDYIENPKVVSHLQYKENIKYWKPKEELLLNEHSDEVLEPKPCTKSRSAMKKEHDNLIIKVNNINIFKNFDPTKTAPVEFNKEHHLHMYRWTSLVHQFAPNRFKRGRFFDMLREDSAQQEKNTLTVNDEEKKKLVEFFGKKAKKEEKTKMDNDVSINKDNHKVVKEFLTQKFSSVVNSNNLNDMKNITKVMPVITKGF